MPCEEHRFSCSSSKNHDFLGSPGGIKQGHSLSRCSNISSFSSQNLHVSDISPGYILLYRSLRLLCPEISSISLFISPLDSFSSSLLLFLSGWGRIFWTFYTWVWSSILLSRLCMRLSRVAFKQKIYYRNLEKIIPLYL